MQVSHPNIQPAIDVKNLCSRKLFEMLSIEEELGLTRQQMKSVEAELVARQHYLTELGRLRGLL